MPVESPKFHSHAICGLVLLNGVVFVNSVALPRQSPDMFIAGFSVCLTTTSYVWIPEHPTALSAVIVTGTRSVPANDLLMLSPYKVSPSMLHSVDTISPSAIVCWVLISVSAFWQNDFGEKSGCGCGSM